MLRRQATGVILLFSAFAFAGKAQSQPTAVDAKRAIEKTMKKIWKDLGTAGERTVLFQSVEAGKASPGSYPFRVTLAIHDYESGYPPNHYYGKTCVGRIEAEPYNLRMDDYGAWLAEGRMTPNMSDNTCKNNTAAGVPSIPLSSVQGTRAAAGGSAPVRFQTVAAGAQQGGGAAVGSYHCWANGQARMLLNFSITSGTQYRDNKGVDGTYRIDGSARISFKGGLLDGFMPAGFYAIYHSPGGRPTVSFRNSGGSEVTFCQKQ